MKRLNPMEMMALRLALRSHIEKLEGFVETTREPRARAGYESRAATLVDLLESMAPGVRVTLEHSDRWVLGRFAEE
jgi:hypothetical protein